LIEAAHTASGLDSSTPYTFTADVALAGETRKGTLVIYRDGDKKRVELKLGDYLEKQISLGNRRYVEPKHALLDAGGFADYDRSWDPKAPTLATAPAPEPSFGKVSAKKMAGERAWCLDEHMKKVKTTLCFDAQRPIMLEKRWEKIRYEFLDFSQAGELLPRTIKVTQDRLPEITLTNIRLSRGPITPELWAPSLNSVLVEDCEDLKNVKPPRAEYTPEPSFPPKASQERRTGKVVLYAIVNDTGKVAFPEALNEDPFGFTDQAKEAVRTWRFAPGTCNGKALNVPMVLEIEFNFAP
jgi:hypothetical protein